MNFKYFSEKYRKVQNPEIVQKAISIGGQSVMIDSQFLPLIESAENGDIIATAELAEAFRDGRKGLKKNYHLAKYYSELMLKNAQGNILLEIEAQNNSGVLEFRFGNYEEAISHYKKANLLMIENLPVDKWKKYIHTNLIEGVEAYLYDEDNKQ